MMSTKSLTELADFHGTNKGTVGPTPLAQADNYTDIYEAYLARHRSAAISLLEIGIGVKGPNWDVPMVQGRNSGGASLKMWYDYFPNASIYGMDINPASHLDNDRIRTFLADGGSPRDLQAFLDATGGVEFDVIVDDGSHCPDHQQIALSMLFQKLKAGGLYFIEDLRQNGIGDKAHGRDASRSVRNTRSVLKHFQRTGAFLEPNALMGAQHLKEHIAYISFHAPKTGFAIEPKLSLRRPLNLFVRYEAGAEKLCAIARK